MKRTEINNRIKKGVRNSIIKRKKIKSSTLVEELADLVAELRLEGKTGKEIAHYLNVSPQTVYSAIHMNKEKK